MNVQSLLRVAIDQTVAHGTDVRHWVKNCGAMLRRDSF